MTVTITTALLLSSLKASHVLQGCNTLPCNPCFNITNRLEIRELSSEHRSIVIKHFHIIKKNHNYTSWTSLVLSENICEFVKLMDDSLSETMLKMPYWDSQIEQKMQNPFNSPVFMDSFFPSAIQPTTETKYRDDLMPQKIKRDQSLKLFLASIKTSRNAQLLSLLNKIGRALQRQIPDKPCYLCSFPNAFLQCNFDSYQCESKLRPGSICSSTFFYDSKCYNSVCIDSLCSVGSRKIPSNIKTISANQKKIQNKRLISTIVLQEQSIHSRYKTDRPIVSSQIKKFSTYPNLKKSRSSEDISKISKKTLEKAQRHFTKDLIKNIKITVTTQAATNNSSLTMPIQNIHKYVKEHTSVPLFVPEKVPVGKVEVKNHKQKIMNFNSTLTYPTVFFTIRINQPNNQNSSFSNSKKRENIDVYVKGQGIPHYFQEYIKGRKVNSNHFMVRVPDPKFAEIVEARVIVKNNGKRCETKCLTQKGTYKKCNKKVLRLSHFVDYGDEVLYYKTEKEAEIALWTSSPYEPNWRRDSLYYLCT